MEEELSALFRQVSRKHRNEVQKTLNQFDLYIGQPQILFFIQCYQRVSQKQIAQELSLTKEALSVSIKRLLKNGLIIRHKDEHDHRIQLISLTDKGHEIVELCRENFNAVNHRMYQYLNGSERSDLIGLFKKMIHGLEGEE